ncbi:hypothetical protein EXIGLDRAFT_845716 [Exidia glandulosa HHB12029]|uniref:Uncharacterized protein n=1 Tax=Exidia glandulosa HHB12029 TaxID=1314781 RepID=A0A165BBB0_EXIGL|nr:hypothetical protein EXIGLDRAFT_845716 [Exidia glandulosa HHB12029]
MSTRPPIPQGNPPTYAFVTRVYRRSLRPIVIICAVTSAIWTLLWYVSNFQDINNDTDNSLPQFVPFDIALGALFMGAFAIELFGVFAATTQRLPLVRFYSFLTLLAALFIAAAQIIQIVLDFKYKSTLLNMCVEANTGSTIIVPHGWWGSTRRILTQPEAQSFCKSILNRNIFADFAWLIVSSILALLFASIVFAFYRQLLDPASMAYPRAPSDQVRMQTFGAYPPPAGAPRPYNEDYVPPYDPHKLPGYDAQGRATPEEKDEPKQAWGAEASQQQFAPPAGPPPSQQYAPPAGPPPQASGTSNPFA